MKTSAFVLCAALSTLMGCAGMNTRVVQLDPAHTFPRTQAVEVLLEKPQRPYVRIALLESEGYSEADLLNDAREKAKTLGADAIVREELQRVYHQPVALYDPWYDPFYFGYHRWRPYPAYGPMWGPYQVVGGGYSYLLKSLAIKYGGPPPAPQGGTPR